MIQSETAQELSEFLMANDDQQRTLFDEPKVSAYNIVLLLIRTRKKPKQQFVGSSISSTMSRVTTS
jgi:hypothetical protein